MKDKKLREFLGVVEHTGDLSAPYYSVNGKHLGMLIRMRDRIESLERYLGVYYRPSPLTMDYPKHIKLTEKVS